MEKLCRCKGQYQRLKQAVEQSTWDEAKMALPSIRGAVQGKNVTIIPPSSKIAALHDVNFEIAAGTVCMIMGPSGAGKSTLVRGILGLWPTSEGQIRIDGPRQCTTTAQSWVHKLAICRKTSSCSTEASVRTSRASVKWMPQM